MITYIKEFNAFQ